MTFIFPVISDVFFHCIELTTSCALNYLTFSLLKCCCASAESCSFVELSQHSALTLPNLKGEGCNCNIYVFFARRV